MTWLETMKSKIFLRNRTIAMGFAALLILASILTLAACGSRPHRRRVRIHARGYCGSNGGPNTGAGRYVSPNDAANGGTRRRTAGRETAGHPSPPLF